MSVFYTIDAVDELPLEYPGSLKFFDEDSARRFLALINKTGRSGLTVGVHKAKEDV